VGTSAEAAKQRRRNPKMARTPEQASAAANASWTPEAYAVRAIKILVEKAPPLTEEQREQLRAVLARPVAQGGR
jgi:hypothetical protein